MRSTNLFAATALIAVAMLPASPRAQTADGDKRAPGHYLVVTNATFDSVTQISIATEGTDDYRVVDLGEPLQGGETSITVDVPSGGCLRTVRALFRNGRSQRFPDIDLCISNQLRLTAGGKTNLDQFAASSH